MWIQIKEEDLPEFFGQLMDKVDDFLEERGVVLPQSVKEMDDSGESYKDTDDPGCRPVLYGTDYDILETRLREVVERWSAKDGGIPEHEGDGHNLEVNCECTMRRAYRITVDDEDYATIKEGLTAPFKGLFDQTVADCMSDPGSIETDYTVYDLDMDKQIFDWN